MRHGIENLCSICYKLHTMGVSVKGVLYINSLVSKPESMLKKKSNAICYHAIHEAFSIGAALVAHIPMKKNMADLVAKVT